MKKQSKKPWKLILDKTYRPSVTILIPAHNEENVIVQKLENIKQIDYPSKSLQVIIVDDGSVDNTASFSKNYISTHGLKYNVFQTGQRVGKAYALNKALELVSTEVVVVSDADCFCSPDTLLKTLLYLSDERIGAVSAMQVLPRPSETRVKENENNYLQLSSILRVGASKTYSTIRFEGGFSAYKRCAFIKFDDETGADDSGTALNIIQNNYRTIVVDGLYFQSDFSTSSTVRFKVKTRRANHLLSLWLKCFSLLMKRKLLMPKRLSIPEISLFLINPIVLVLLAITTIVIFLTAPFSLLSNSLILLIILSIILGRKLFFEIVTDNLVLFYSLIKLLFGKRYHAWDKA